MDHTNDQQNDQQNMFEQQQNMNDQQQNLFDQPDMFDPQLVDLNQDTEGHNTTGGLWYDQSVIIS